MVLPLPQDPMSKRRAAAALAAGLVIALSSWVAFAAISISTATPFVQDFNTIGTSATATLPADFRVDRTTTSTAGDVRRVLTWAGAGTQTTQAGSVNLSTSAANGIYNFGVAAASTERAIGFLASGTATASGNLYAELVNDTGAPLSGLSIAYNVEKYRNGSNANGFRIQLFWSNDGVAWTNAGSAFMTAFPADANNNGFAIAPGATVAVSDVLDVTIQPGANFYLAWNYSVTAGTTVTNAQALAVDDISILGVASDTPSAQGTADPASVLVGAATTFTATAFGGSNPTSTGLLVSCDLTGIGGSETFSLPNTSGNTYSASYGPARYAWSALPAAVHRDR